MRGWPALGATAVLHVGVLAVPVLRPPTPELAPRVELRLEAAPEPEPPPPPKPEPDNQPEPEPEPEPEPQPEPQREPEPPPPTPKPAPPSPAPEATPEPPQPPAPAHDPIPSPPPEAEPSPTAPALPAPRPEPKPAAPEITPRAQPGPGKAEYGAYAKDMRASMLRHRRYPPAALRLGLEGVTKLELSIDKKGRIVGEPRVKHSSGHAVLDEEALRIVRVAAPYGALPDGTTKDVMVFVIPIDFRVQTN